jgi:hypothetical protein
VSGIWALYGLWKNEIKKWIPIILVWRVLEKYEREILYEERKSNTHEWVKVGRLVALSFFLYLSFALIPF